MKNIEAKIQDWATAQKNVSYCKSIGYEVVFTNGCFDILHYGHFRYLCEAKALGDLLVVGVNSDASVQRLKGSHRPIHDLKTRLTALAALSFVDVVVVFEQDTPLELIEWLRPDVLVKGGDYEPHQIVGADIVLSGGGSVQSLAFAEGYSTTAIEQKISGLSTSSK